MKRILILTCTALALTACVPGVNFDNGPYLNTAPGAALPGSVLAACREKDPVDRCKRWEPHTDQCINPKGINEPKPLVPCASISKSTTK